MSNYKIYYDMYSQSHSQKYFIQFRYGYILYERQNVIQFALKRLPGG
jgi:hypothetical protein